MPVKTKRNSFHPVDHMKYAILIQELSKEENSEYMDSFLKDIENSSPIRRDRRIPTINLIENISTIYDSFLNKNTDLLRKVSDISDSNDPEILLRASGINPDEVSVEFKKDLHDIYRYYERIGKDSNNELDPRKFLVDNKKEIIELSSLTENRDIFKGLTFGFIHNKNTKRHSRINSNGNIITDFHGFSFNSRELLKNDNFMKSISFLEEKLDERRLKFIEENRKKREAQKLKKSMLAEKVNKATKDFVEDAAVGPHVSDYMKYLLMLNEITKDDNNSLFDKYVQGLLSEKAYEDTNEITVEQLIDLDFSENLIAERLNVISKHVPEIRDTVDSYIQQFDSEVVLEKAGFENKKLPEHFKNDVKTLMAFEATFPEPNKPAISERLSTVKDSVLNVLAKDHSRIALSGVMLAVSCTVAAPVGIALSGATLAKTLLQNDKVVNILNKGQEKLNNALVKIGIKKEKIIEKDKRIGDKLKSFFDNKYVKNTLKVAGIGAAVFGVGALTAPYFEDGTISSLAGNLANDASEAGSKISNLISEKASALSASIENIEMPDVSMPDVSMPDVSMPDVSMPDVSMPDVSMPDFDQIASSTSEILSHSKDSFMSKLEELINFAESELNDFELNSTLEAVASQSANLAENLSSLTDETVIIKDGDRLMDLAKSKLESEFGFEPSVQQVAQLVDDLGLEDPNNIQIGQEINFPSDLEKYKDVESIKNMDWLNKENSPIDVGHFDMSSNYNIQDIIKNTGSLSSIEDIADLNKGLDLGNLNPGDEIKLPTESGIIEYTVPEIDDAIISTVFPDGVPQFLDKEAFVEMIKDANPDVDLSSGFLFGNSDFGKDILANKELVIPEINISDLNPNEKTFILDANKIHGTNDVNETLINVAYPNGVPELVDRNMVIRDIMNNNPGLEELIESNKGFEQKVTIGGENMDMAMNESIEKDKISQNKLFEKGSNESFINRIKEKNSAPEFS